MESPMHSLSPIIQSDLKTQGQRVRLEPGTFICLEGAECHVVPVVISGSVRVYKMSEEGREITLYRVEEGQTCIITTSCVANGRPFPAFAVAETAVEAWGLPAGSFRALLDESEPWRAYVFDQMLGRLEHVIELVESVAFARVDERLLAYVTEAGVGSLERTHEEIASDLGTSREVVSRLLKDLERKGRVKLGRGRITVL
jgi:CRP/FNR family transcriptional regulator, anaerobic regulatory protein